MVEFPQTGSARRKRRPALVVLDIGDLDIILAPITTKDRSGRGDYKLRDWRTCGLLRDSWVRLAKIACLEKSGYHTPFRAIDKPCQGNGGQALAGPIRALQGHRVMR